MTFGNLTTELQTILLVQYSFFFKSILILGGLIFALVYLFYWKSEKEKPTPFFSIGIIRTIITVSSALILLLFPLMLLLLNPEYELSSAVNTFFPIYLTFLILGAVGLVIDLFYFFPVWLLKLGGFDFQNKRINSVLKSLNKYFKKNG